MKIFMEKTESETRICEIITMNSQNIRIFASKISKIMGELVSVIMPTYNSGRLLKESIDSILNQTYRNLELLITDDNSNDVQTREMLKRYSEKDKRVNLVLLDSNHGPGYARNKSIERAKGRYIAFCDSDDRWFSDKLERQLAFITEQNCALCYSSYIMCDDKDKELGITIAPAKMTFNKLKRDNQIGCLTAIYDTQMLGKKYYMTAIRKRQDWGLFLNILRDCQEAYAIKEPLAFYRIRKNSVSRNKMSLIKYNILIYQKILGYSPLKSHLYFLFIFIPNHFLKKTKQKIDSWRYICNSI